MEPIKDKNGKIVGEFEEKDGKYLVWKRERSKTNTPPGNVHTLLGCFDTDEEARQVAEKLRIKS